MTADEIRDLDQYARNRFIELVPCQNCLGHMEAWLAVPELNDLAEAPEGLALVPGLPPRATTLDPSDPRSIQFVKTLFDELLPHFSSGQVNINMDEPYELGRGKNQELAEKIGIDGIYLLFLDQVLSIVRDHGKKPLMWGDVLFHYPELISRLPGELTVLDWLYEGKSSFEDHAKMLHENKIPFIVCPGTSSWNSIAGRTDNMLVNILDAAENGIRYGANGLLVTDWGDYGHWQTLPVSYAGYAYAAAFSWFLEGNQPLDAAAYLDSFVFLDEQQVMGRFWQDLGNYYLYENAILPNITLTFLALSPLTRWNARDSFDQKLNLYYQLIQTIGGVFGRYPFDTHRQYDYHGLKDFLAIMAHRLEMNRMRCDNRKTVYHEARYTLQLVGHGVDLYQFAHEMTILSHQEVKDRLALMLEDLEQILDAFFSLWPGRNRKGASANRNAMGFHILMARYMEQMDHPEDESCSEEPYSSLAQFQNQRHKDRRDEIDHLDAGNFEHVEPDADNQE